MVFLFSLPFFPSFACFSQRAVREKLVFASFSFHTPNKPHVFGPLQNVGFVVVFWPLDQAYLAWQEGGASEQPHRLYKPQAIGDGFHQEEMFPRMEKHALFQPTIKRAALPASVFLLPGILPADRRLLFDPETHTVLLLAVAGSDAVPMFQSFQVPPSASRVFFTLLQAFPLYCSHQTLFRSLYPQIPEEDQQEWNWQQTLAVPLVRRALKALLPVLRGCGLQAISLRGQGYVLAAITHPQVFPEQGRRTVAQGH